MYPLLLQGHDRPLTWVQFNRDGDLMFTCGKDANLSLWRTEDGRRIGTYDVGKGVVWACDCTLDSKRLVAASADQKILIDGDTPRRLWVQDDYAGRCVHVHWGPFDETIISTHENGDIMSCSDGTAKLWSTKDWECLKTYTTDRPLNACGLSPLLTHAGPERRMHLLLGGGQAAEDVTTTASGEGKFEALLYHAVRGEEIASCKGHFGPLHTLAWKPDGTGYASGGEDGYVRLYTFDDEYFTDDKFQ